MSSRSPFPDAPAPWVFQAVDEATAVRVRAEPLVVPSSFGVGLPIRAMRFAIDDDASADAHWSIALPKALLGAVPRRRATYLAGRACAALALHAAGHASPIPVVGRDRRGAPVWPDGFTGSIAHTDGESLAIATSTDVLVGVDIERLMAGSTAETVGRRIAPEVLARAYAGAESIDQALAVTLAFSAKESVYKCLHPRVQRFFGFEAATVRAITDASIEVELAEGLHDSLPAGTQLTVEWASTGDAVLTMLRFSV